MIPWRTDLSQICISTEDFQVNSRFQENRTRPYYIFSLIKLNEVAVCLDFIVQQLQDQASLYHS